LSWHQAVIGTLIAFILIGLGGWFLVPLKIPFSIPKTLRILYGFHLFVLGLMMAIGQFFLENKAQSLANLSDAAASRGELVQYSRDDLAFAAAWGIYWLCFTLLFVSFICLAFWDSLRRSRKKFINPEYGKRKKEFQWHSR